MQEKLEEIAGQIDEHSTRLEHAPIYMPQNGFLDKIRGYRESMEPAGLYEHLWRITNPGTYYLWKMPPEAHQRLNNVLGKATSVLSVVQPEAAIATGAVQGISQVVYGLKTSSGNGSGKHIISGLTRTLMSLRKIKSPQAERAANDVESFLDDYMVGFDNRRAA